MIFMAMGALMLGNLLQSFVDDDEQNIDDRQWIWTHYGTAYRALYTLFEITFAGNFECRAVFSPNPQKFMCPRESDLNPKP